MTVFKKFQTNFTVLTIIFLWSLAALAAAKKANVKVRLADNLNSIGKHSSKNSIPILVVFASEDCVYCMILENEILKPMLISGDYDQKVIIRKILIDIPNSVQDFNGRSVTIDKLTSRYNIFVTPTVLFLDNNGKEISKRLIGINVVDYYALDVDNAIDKSIRILRARAKKLSAEIKDYLH